MVREFLSLDLLRLAFRPLVVSTQIVFRDHNVYRDRMTHYVGFHFLPCWYTVFVSVNSLVNDGFGESVFVFVPGSHRQSRKCRTIVVEALEGAKVRPRTCSVSGPFRESKYYLCNSAKFVASSSTWHALHHTSASAAAHSLLRPRH